MVASSKVSSGNSRVSTPTPAGRLNRQLSLHRTFSSGSGSAIIGASPQFSNFHYHSRNDSFNSATSRHCQNTSSPVNQLQQFEEQLEHRYDLQKNERLSKFIARFPEGIVPDEETERFKQTEAIERTKFIVFKETQIGKFNKGLTSPFRDSLVPSPEAAPPVYEAIGPRSIGRFEIGKRKSPPRLTLSPSQTMPSQDSKSLASADNTIAQSVDTSQFGTTVAVEAALEAPATVNNGGAAITSDFTNDQILFVFQRVFEELEVIKKENQQLKQDMSNMKHGISLLLDGTENVPGKIAELEQNVSALQSFYMGQDMPIATHEIADLRVSVANELKSIKAELVSLKNIISTSLLSKQTFDHENHLNKLTIHNKTQLIEKYLGIDITTTGPKPHNVLEALHSRIWRLETSLNPQNPGSAYGWEYRPLNDVMKTTITKGNAMVGYSATPGFGTNDNLSDTSSMNGGTAASERNIVSHRRRMSNAPTWSQSSQNGNGDVLPQLIGMKFDRTDIRYQRRTSNQKAVLGAVKSMNNVSIATGADNAFSKPIDTGTWTNTTAIDLLSESPLILQQPHFSNAAPATATTFTVNAPEPMVTTLQRAPSNSSSGSEFGAIGSGRPKQGGSVVTIAAKPTSGNLVESVSTMQTKSSDGSKERMQARCEGAPHEVAREAAVKEAATKAWFMQKPGDLVGKPLIGLGQKK